MLSGKPPLGQLDKGDGEAVDKSPLSPTMSTDPQVLKASAAAGFVFYWSIGHYIMGSSVP